MHASLSLAHTYMAHACAKACDTHSHAYMHTPMHVAPSRAWLHACGNGLGASFECQLDAPIQLAHQQSNVVISIINLEIRLF